MNQAGIARHAGTHCAGGDVAIRQALANFIIDEGSIHLAFSYGHHSRQRKSHRDCHEAPSLQI